MTVSGKIPHYRFVCFPTTDGGSWSPTADSKKHRKFKGNRIRRLTRSPLPTVEVLFILSPHRGCR
jgi:hypothetical protein